MSSPIEGQLPPPLLCLVSTDTCFELFSALSLSSLPIWSKYAMPSNSALLSRPQISLLLPIYTTAFSDPGQCFMWIAASLQRPWPGQVLIVNQARALPRERVKQGDAQLTTSFSVGSNWNSKWAPPWGNPDAGGSRLPFPPIPVCLRVWIKLSSEI